jgi:hypothetical protein
MRYCARNGLPPLTVLVVAKDSGKPGAGLSTTADVDADRERVFRHDWYRMLPMSVEAFEASESDAAERGG